MQLTTINGYGINPNLVTRVTRAASADLCTVHFHHGPSLTMEMSAQLFAETLNASAEDLSSQHHHEDAAASPFLVEVATLTGAAWVAPRWVAALRPNDQSNGAGASVLTSGGAPMRAAELNVPALVDLFCPPSGPVVGGGGGGGEGDSDENDGSGDGDQEGE